MHAQSSVCVLGRRVGGGGKLEQLLATFYLKNCKQFYTKAVELFLYLTSTVLGSSLSLCGERAALTRCLPFYALLICLEFRSLHLFKLLPRKRATLWQSSLSVPLFVKMTVEFLFLFCHPTYFRFHFHWSFWCGNRIKRAGEGDARWGAYQGKLCATYESRLNPASFAFA